MRKIKSIISLVLALILAWRGGAADICGRTAGG